MTHNISDLSVFTAQFGDKWIAATSESPYFCFEADSEQAALRVAARALDFYASVSASVEEREARERETATPTFDVKSKVRAKELAAA